MTKGAVHAAVVFSWNWTYSLTLPLRTAVKFGGSMYSTVYRVGSVIGLNQL